MQNHGFKAQNFVQEEESVNSSNFDSDNKSSSSKKEINQNARIPIKKTTKSSNNQYATESTNKS